jgi:hypothetical protein
MSVMATGEVLVGRFDGDNGELEVTTQVVRCRCAGQGLWEVSLGAVTNVAASRSVTGRLIQDAVLIDTGEDAQTFVLTQLPPERDYELEYTEALAEEIATKISRAAGLKAA